MKSVAWALRHVARLALWLAAAGLIMMTVFITAQVVRPLHLQRFAGLE
jgi:hypothetical protein